MRFNKSFQVPITLVCTTYNRPISLFKLLNSVEKNLYKPSEIIIVGTSILDFKMINNKKFEFKIIKIISPKKNQIYQRNLGLKKSSNLLVIQSDDDLTYERDFFKNFYKHFKVNKNIKKLVGAKILTTRNKNQSSRWNENYHKYFLFRVILKILNKFNNINYMSILSSGRIAPLLPLKSNDSKSKHLLNDIEWLSSTCCYNLKKIKKINISKKNIQKKSFFEDVIFTHYQFMNGFKLIIDDKIICHHPFINPTNFMIYKDTIKTQWQIVKLFNKSKIFFFVDIIIFGLLFALKDLKKVVFRR